MGSSTYIPEKQTNKKPLSSLYQVPKKHPLRIFIGTVWILQKLIWSIVFPTLDPDIFYQKGKLTPGKGFPTGSDGKESACNVGYLGSTPGSGRSPREENGNPLQYSCLENFMARGAWQATVHGVTESDTTKRLSLTHSSLSRVIQFPLLCPLYLYQDYF